MIRMRRWLAFSLFGALSIGAAVLWWSTQDGPSTPGAPPPGASSLRAEDAPTAAPAVLAAAGSSPAPQVALPAVSASAPAAAGSAETGGRSALGASAAERIRGAQDEEATRRAEHDRVRAERRAAMLERTKDHKAQSEQRRQAAAAHGAAYQASLPPDPNRPAIESLWPNGVPDGRAPRPNAAP
jgi:hypothetical protein